MKKISTLTEAMEHLKDGMTLMIGGFLGIGTPELLIDAIVEKKLKDLTIICNDTSFPDQGIGKLVCNGCVKKVITSHIGTNPETGRLMNEGLLEVVLTPQGTIAEQIRAAGSGLGAVITPTGVGTVVEEGKETMVINGKKYLVELPLKADIKGNLVYAFSGQNFNPLMAMAADFVIAQVDSLVPQGGLDPNFVHTPHIFIDMIVEGGQNG
jgi:acetate CoA/acetoacetate CoA-transferase alpha subunit